MDNFEKFYRILITVYVFKNKMGTKQPNEYDENEFQQFQKDLFE